MKVSIDPDLCTACGLCTDSVPEVFEMADDVAEVKKSDVPSNLENDVREAAEDCPVEAIIVQE
jgi:ferredoxin